MTQRHWFGRCLELGWVGLLGWLGAIAIASSTFAQSKIVPDNTLGAESSVVTPNIQGLPVEAITGGAVRGANLFHSFREFNVSAGRGAYFFSPNASIQNILTRVTGSNRSEILGTLGTIGNSAPNLFLINPNGIIFGPNAALNIGGSFVGTTANAVQFGNRGIFSASAPVAPSSLLTINPSALLFNQLSPAAITNKSTAPAGPGPIGVEVTGLRVPDGRSLLLVGGSVNLDGGSLRAYEGRIELAGLAAPGSFGLNVVDNTLSLSVPEGVQRADVSLTNGAEVNVRAANAGSIAINAHSVNLAGASKLRAGIESGLGTPNSKAGDIEINATGETALSDRSFIANVVQSEAIGKGGNIKIATGSLSLRNNTSLNTSTSGQGDGGSIFVQASGEVSIANSKIFSNVESGAVGKGGDINISAGSLSLKDGSQLNAITFGNGDAGNIIINARDTISLDGSSYALSDVQSEAVGNSGDILVTTGSLSLKGGAYLSTNVYGQGNAGNITIDARDAVKFDGIVGNSISGVQSNVINTEAVGKGGDIRMTTGSLWVTNGAMLSTNMYGTGNAGNITINARDTVTFDGVGSAANELFGSSADSTVGSNGIGNGGDIRVSARTLLLKNGGQLKAQNIGQGNAGNITIDVRDTVTFDGVGSNASTIAIENGGDIFVTTGKLWLTNGGNLSTFAYKNAGNININTRDAVNFDGISSDGFPSGVFSDLLPGNPGKAGDIQMTTGTLTVRNGARLGSSTYGQGNGGNITINARDRVKFDGTSSDGRASGAFSTVEQGAFGKGGDISITTGSLAVTNGAVLSSSTTGQGNAGNIQINATDSVNVFGISSSSGNIGSGTGLFVRSQSAGSAGDIFVTSPKVTLDNSGRFIAESASGNGGNINLLLGDLLLLRRGSQISTNAGTAQKGGDGGNININSKFVVAVPQENSDITANAYTGTGGNVQINATAIFGIQSRPQSTDLSDITASSTLGVAGAIDINTPDTDALQNSLTQLPDNIIDANALIANSCIARRNNQSGGTFLITGLGGLPERPGDAPLSPYPTGTIRSVPSVGEPAKSTTSNTSRHSRKNSTPIVEAQGIYRLANGDLVLSRECP